jgi:CheY-like chemotaxis protein/anti-sigma regulatory factor (Ser/Thr protein kinase)
MVRRLLNFARQNPSEFSRLDFNAILKDESSLLERTTLAKVCTQLDLAPDLRPIRGDASALTHAIMNLCVNAVDAMPVGGTLTLRTRNLDEDWIEVRVEDTGAGMPKEVLEKALDPFFTTKGIGKGTGLGLSMVYSTVKAHGGELFIQSESGSGTCILMRFPACGDEELSLSPPESRDVWASDRRVEVLLVDDDELIQISVQTLFEVLGHRVHAAESGEEALAVLAGGFKPDLVILDMNMPGLGGVGTLPQLRVLDPEVPILLSTGRTDDAARSLAAAHPGVTLVSKPFGLRELQKHLECLGLA